MQNNFSKTAQICVVKPPRAPQFPQLQQSKPDPRQKKFARLPCPVWYSKEVDIEKGRNGMTPLWPLFI
jgi:hypothetical protein